MSTVHMGGGTLLLPISLSGRSQKHFALSTHLISPHNYRLCNCTVMFFIFYMYYFGHCSKEFSHWVPSPKNWGRKIRLASFLYESCVEIGHPLINRYNYCFFLFIANLLKCLIEILWDFMTLHDTWHMYDFLYTFWL